jgi:hypothetical protein
MGWILYHTQHHLFIKAAGIYVMNNEETQEFGFQFGAEEGGSSFCSAEHVLAPHKKYTEHL